MKTVRLLAVSAVTIGAGLLVPTGVAVAAPTAPYHAMTVDLAPPSGLSGPSASSSYSSVLLEASTPPFFVVAASDPTYGNAQVTLAPPLGSEFITGGQYPVGGGLSQGLGYFDLVQHGQQVCPGASGFLFIEDAGYQGSDIVNLAATYELTCGDFHLDGEIRALTDVGYVGATETNPDLSFGQHDLGAYTPLTVTINSVGSDPLVFGTAALGGTNPGEFTIGADTCSGQSIAGGSTCSITIDPEPTGPGDFAATLSIPDNSALGYRYAQMTMQPEVGGAGTFQSVAPTRLVDTRIGTGAPEQALGPGSVLAFQVTGEGGIPSGHVSAVVLNVTETGATATSYLTAYPDGTSRPATSNLNFPANRTLANSVTVPVGSDGKVDIYNFAGNVQVIVDVSGYFVADDLIARGGAYQRVTPSRLLDTRTDLGPVPAHYEVTVPFTFGPDIDPQVAAVAVNITAVNPTTSGYLTSWDGTGYPPTVSTLNFVKGATVPNMAVVPTGDFSTGDGTVPDLTIYNGESSGSTDILVDIIGFFDTGSLDGGLRYQPLTPTRILDSRIGLGTPSALGARDTATISAASISDDLTWGLAMNLTAVAPTATTYVTVWGDGTRPPVSTLNAVRGQTVPNATIAPLTDDLTFNLYNNAGTTNLVADIAGKYDLYPYTLTPNAVAITGIAPSGVAPGASAQRVQPSVFTAANEPAVYRATAPLHR